MSKKINKVLIVIPCLNEAGNIERVLDQILGLKRKDIDILVIDDGSTDETYSIASSKVLCVQLFENLGIGGAVQTGIKYAFYNGYEYCLQVDGDDQHPLKAIINLIDEMKKAKNKVNLLIGSRYIIRGSFQSTFLRRFGSLILSKILYILFQQVFTDSTSGLRILDRSTIKLFAKNYHIDYPEPISIATAIKMNLVIKEIPVEMRERKGGISSINTLTGISYMIRVTFSLFLEKLRKKTKFI